jgi:hypothetical protein
MNGSLSALYSNHSGAAAPATPIEGQGWVDTSGITANPPVVKLKTYQNGAWYVLGTLNVQTGIYAVSGALSIGGGTMSGAIHLPAGSAASPALLFTGGNNSGLYIGSGNSVNVGIDGNERLRIESTGMTVGSGRLFVHGIGGGALLHLDKRAGNESVANRILGRVNVTNRWIVDVGDSSNETGGDAGSNFMITRHNDAGGSLGASMLINRQDGRVSFYSAPNSWSVGATLAPNATSWAAVSDEREKDIVGPVTGGVDAIVALRPIRYRYKSEAPDAPARIGFGAQTTLPVIPESIGRTTNTEGEERLTLAPTELIPHLVAAIQELAAEIAVLKARLNP